MKQAFLALAALALAVLIRPAWGAEDDALAAALAEISARYAPVDAMRAEFVQTTKSDVFGDTTQKGEVMLERPNRMRWSFVDDRTFVTDGRSMWVYSKVDNQVIVYDDISGQRSSLDSLLASLDKLQDQFVVSLVERGDDKLVIDLAPKGDEQVKRVRLHFGKDLALGSLEVVDPFDAVTEITFTTLELGAKLPAGTFTFSAPEGTEVITAGGF